MGRGHGGDDPTAERGRFDPAEPERGRSERRASCSRACRLAPIGCPRDSREEPQGAEPPAAFGSRRRGGRRGGRGGDRPRPRRPTRRSAAFFDVDNTMMQGASIFHLARGLHRREFFTTREILAAAWKQAYFRVVGVEDPEHVAETRASALSLHRRPHRRRARGARRGDLRRGDGPPDLAGHPRAGPAAPRRGPAGLAGDRGADRDRPDHRPPARPDRRAGHGRRARGRRLHRPAGRRHAARPGQGGGDQGAGRPRGARPRAAARRTPTPSTTCRCSRWSATRARSTPTPGCGPTPSTQGWRIRDYRTGRKAARAGVVHGAPWPAPPPAPSPPASPYAAVAAERRRLCPGPFRLGWPRLPWRGAITGAREGCAHDVG